MKTCSTCRMGNLHEKHVTYANWHAGRFVVVPNMLARMCDVCAAYEFDAEALNRLLPLLGPVTRLDSSQSSRGQHRSGDVPRDDLGSDRDRRRA